MIFSHPLFRITIWVAWNAANGIKQVELLSKDGSSHILKDISAFCDMPYTTAVHMQKLVTKVLCNLALTLILTVYCKNMHEHFMVKLKVSFHKESTKKEFNMGYSITL